jgi:hypothetical protein
MNHRRGISRVGDLKTRLKCYSKIFLLILEGLISIMMLMILEKVLDIKINNINNRLNSISRKVRQMVVEEVNDTQIN